MEVALKMAKRLYDETVNLIKHVIYISDSDDDECSDDDFAIEDFRTPSGFDVSEKPGLLVIPSKLFHRDEGVSIGMSLVNTNNTYKKGEVIAIFREDEENCVVTSKQEYEDLLKKGETKPNYSISIPGNKVMDVYKGTVVTQECRAGRANSYINLFYDISRKESVEVNCLLQKCRYKKRWYAWIEASVDIDMTGKYVWVF